MDMVHTVLLALILVASVVAPMIVYLRLRAQQRAETERLIARMEEALGSSVKLLEVRTYYDQISAEYKKMLDEAFREGNRFRQDHVRRLIERLEQSRRGRSTGPCACSTSRRARARSGTSIGATIAAGAGTVRPPASRRTRPRGRRAIRRPSRPPRRSRRSRRRRGEWRTADWRLLISDSIY